MRFSIVAIVIRLSAVTFLTVTVWSVQAKRPLLSRPESSLVRVIFVVPSSNVPPPAMLTVKSLRSRLP